MIEIIKKNFNGICYMNIGESICIISMSAALHTPFFSRNILTVCACLCVCV